MTALTDVFSTVFMVQFKLKDKMSQSDASGMTDTRLSSNSKIYLYCLFKRILEPSTSSRLGVEIGVGIAAGVVLLFGLSVLM